MIIKIKSLIVFSFFVTTILAQSSGYMGKHFVINYGIHASPTIIGASKNNTTLLGNLESPGSAEPQVITFNNLHEFSLDYVKSNKLVVELNVKYYKTAYDNNANLNNRGSNFDFSGSPAGYYSIRGLSYALIFKKYNSKYVAPWGRYVLFGPVINTVKTTYDENMNKRARYKGSNSTIDSVLSYFGDKEQKFIGFNLIFGWGRSHIIKDRIVVDYGASLQLFSLVSLPFDILNLNAIDDKQSYTNLTYISDTYKTRVRGINRFNVFLKVGYLF